MSKMSRILFATCAVLSAPIAWAQEGILFPDGKADTILVCEREGSPVPECTVGCAISWSGQAGTTPPPQQGSGFNIQNAQRVELYGNGSDGRADSRVWIAIQYPDNTDPRVMHVFHLNFANPVFCQFHGIGISESIDPKFARFVYKKFN
ncbi:MAG: hypothetical protein M9905_03375 [Rhizobiaceae bacterium]|nr:hypothetical protein [Rhizobiaceae bacterium]